MNRGDARDVAALATRQTDNGGPVQHSRSRGVSMSALGLGPLFGAAEVTVSRGPWQ